MGKLLNDPFEPSYPNLDPMNPDTKLLESSIDNIKKEIEDKIWIFFGDLLGN